MKAKLSAALLIAVTAIAVLIYPKLGNSGNPVTPPLDIPVRAPQIEVVFALDTTGSMSGLIQAAKEKIWSIANSMASAQNAPDIRVGLVAYRDRGDAYVTQVTDLSQDLDSVYATLMDFQAAGGGDTPESVNAALSDAINRISWSTDGDVYKVVFLVGDAPPHMDYADEPRYPELMRDAVAKGIIVNTIRCGTDARTAQLWQQIAALTQGSYFSVEQSGSAIAIATPFDKKLAELSRELDETRLVFGDAATIARDVAKSTAIEKLHAFASDATRARRAAFNAVAAGKKSLFGDSDLVEMVTSGKTSLTDIAVEALPAPMQELSVAEREAFVETQVAKRAEINEQIEATIRLRDSYIEEQVESEEVESSLDYKLFDLVKEQAAEAGIRYDDAAAPKL